MVQSTPSTEARRRQQARAERRLEIIRRAAEVFREKGYHRAGMREIAEGLGLQPGALYHYFESKDDLLLACQELSLTRLTEGAREVVASRDPPATKLAALARLHLEQILEVTGGSAAHLEFDALPLRHGRALVRRRDAYEREVRRVLEEGVSTGAFRAVDPRFAAFALLGALNWTVVWWRPGGAWSVAQVAGRIARLFLRGLEPTAECERETSA